MTSNILVPFFGMMLLTLVVWIWMYIVRISWILENNISAEKLKSPEALNQIIPEAINRPANNFKNLFELPVLFYITCLYLIFLQQTSQIQVYCAYGFFLMRVFHSLIHCTTNIVIWRFTAYLISSICLWMIIINIGLSTFGL